MATPKQPNKARALKDIRKDYAEAKAVADTDLESMPKLTRPGWAMRKQKARDTVVALKSEVLESFRDRSLGIFAVGDGASVFANVASARSGAGVFDVNRVYESAAAEAKAATPRSNSFTTNMYGMVQKWLRLQYMDMGLLYFKFPTVKSKTLGSVDGVVPYVKELIRGVAADSISLWHLRNFIIDWGLASTSTVPAIVVMGVDEDEVKGLAAPFQNVVTVKTPAGMTEAEAEAALEQVRMQLKSKKK